MATTHEDPICLAPHPSRPGVKCRLALHFDGVHVATVETPSAVEVLSWIKATRTKGDMERLASRAVLARF